MIGPFEDVLEEEIGDRYGGGPSDGCDETNGEGVPPQEADGQGDKIDEHRLARPIEDSQVAVEDAECL